MTPSALHSSSTRLPMIEQARRSLFGQDAQVGEEGQVGDQREGQLPGIAPWIQRSWRRCLANGRQPDERVSFEAVSAATIRQVQDENQPLLEVAKPVLDKLARAIADTRYFAILTDAQGIVIDVNGPIDRHDRHAHLITRIGVDLSERAVGTTAIGAVLKEQQPVWLHRGEHFFADTSVYSCAGAPLFGPDGNCVGMLDLTGVEAVERPELKHLVTQSARSIENALTIGRLSERPETGGLLIRLNWPGRSLGEDDDGLICLDPDGWVTGANQTARQLVPQLDRAAFANPARTSPLHSSDLFAMPFEMLFDAGRQQHASPLEVPLWTGLRLQALPLRRGQRVTAAPFHMENSATLPQPLKELETALIRKAVDDARGNVLQAAKALGVSRATVYRRLGQRSKS